MVLLLISFLAGILTILTPCSFTLLPVILSAGLENEKNKFRPYIIVISLAVSILLFSILLKATTLLINIPLSFWSMFSGALIILLGISFLFPSKWSLIIDKLKFRNSSEKTLNKKMSQNGVTSAIVSGFVLGPIFTGCSPTYLAIVSILLPANFVSGLVYLLAYCVGLAFVLFLVIVFGRNLTSRFKWAVNPSGNFRKILGLILLAVGVLIFLGLHKQIEASLINTEFTRNIINFENGFLKEQL